MPPRKRSPSAAANTQRSFELARKLDDRLILCIDPGELTGFCTMNKASVVREIGNFDFDTMYTRLNEVFAKSIQLVIMEDYIVGSRAGKLIGTRSPATQIIGAVHMWASHYKIPIVMQMPGILVIAEKMSGKVPKGAHKDNHWLDAFNHGYYWLHSVGLIKPLRRPDGTQTVAPRVSSSTDRVPTGSRNSSYISGGGPHPKSGYRTR